MGTYDLGRFTAFTLFALSLITSAGCGKKSDPGPAAGLLKGFGLSPKGFPLDYSQLAGFYSEVGTLSNGAAMWNGAWRDDAVNGTNAGTAPAAAAAIEQASATNHFTPVAVFGWRTGTTLYLKVPANATNDWTNANAKSLFTSMLTAFATANHPPFVFLGNENDFYYTQSASDYANWISYYNAAYDAIKAASPSTQVGPVFNVEHLAGSGSLNGWASPCFQAIDTHDFTRVDLVGLTVYPFFNYATAAAVPSTYMDAVLAHVQGKPIAITETGWPAENTASLNPAWETSTTAQTTYLTQLGSILRGKNVRFVNWLYLNPEADPGGSPTSWKQFGSISVRDSAGAERPIYAAWRAFSP